MARPLKNNADYFPHDKDMRNDPKIRALRGKFGNDGFSAWIYILESLTNADNFKIKWDELNIELLSFDFSIPSDLLKNIVEYMCKIELVIVENHTLYCPNHLKRMAPLEESRERKRVWEQKKSGKQNITDVQNDISDIHNTTVKESKVKESKVKESKVIKEKEKKEKGEFQENEKSEDRSAVEDERTQENAPQVPAAPPVDDPEKIIRQWGASDKWAWVADAVKMTGYNPSETGVSVNDKTTLFCAHHSANESFRNDPVGFFKQKFKGWLVNGKKVAPAGKQGGSRPPQRQAPAPAAPAAYTEESVRAIFRARYGMLADSLRTNHIAKLVQAKSEAEFSIWIEQIYEAIKSPPLNRRGNANETTLGAVISNVIPTQ